MLEQHTASCSEDCTACSCTERPSNDQQTPTPQQKACGGHCTCKPNRAAPPKQQVVSHIFYLTGRCGVTGPGENPALLYDTISWLYDDLNPVGAMQSLLVSQIISSFLVIQTQLFKSSQEPVLEQANMRINMASKLMRALNVQLNLLATLKGMKVQSVKVEHLSVTGNSVIGIGGHVEQGGHRG